MTVRVKYIGKAKRTGKSQWRIEVEAGINPATGRRKRLVRQVEGRENEAWVAAAELEKSFDEGSYVEPVSITLGTWLNIWLNEYKRLDIRPTTWESYEVMARVHIKPALGEMPIKKLRSEHIQQLYREKSAQGLSPRTIRYIHHVIRSSLDQAIKNGLLAKNPSLSTSLPPTKTKEITPLTLVEQNSFLSALSGERLAAAFLVLLGTGLRRGELLGLKWCDVDLVTASLYIRQNLVRAEGKLIYQEPKTARSRRIVPLPGVAVTALEDHRDLMQKEENYGLDKPVFCTTNSTPIIPRNFQRVFDRLLKKAGLKETGLHTLRHTFATRMLEMGENLKVVQELLGHANIQITANTYSHVSNQLMRDAAGKMDRQLVTGLSHKKGSEDPMDPQNP